MPLKNIFATFVWASFFLLCLQQATAQEIRYPQPQYPPRLVNDFAKVLSYTETQWLEDKLLAFDKESSTQVNIIILDSTGTSDIALYATEIGNRWGIGRKGKDNGVVLLVAVKDRKVNISPGYGLEGVLPDVTCQQIINKELLPSFKDGYYYDGLDKGTDAIIAATKGTYKSEGSYGSSSKGMPRWLIILLLIVGINGALLGIPWLFRRLWEKITGKKIRRRKSSYDYSYQAPAAQEEEDRSSKDSSGGGSGNDGFGGYGGGRFGGGGASGSW